MKRCLINLLRELGVTLDALLGGDHRRYGHQPPSNMVHDGTKHTPILGYSNENWVLVERYVNTYSPPDFRLVFKRYEMTIDMSVPEDVWRAFDGLKLPNGSPPPKINPIVKMHLEQVVRNYLKDPSDINLTALNAVLDTMEG